MSRDSRGFSKQTIVDKHLEKISLIGSSVESACSSSPTSVTAHRSDPIRIFFGAQRKQKRHQKKVKKILSLSFGKALRFTRCVEWKTETQGPYCLRYTFFDPSEPVRSLLLPIAHSCRAGALFVFPGETACTRQCQFDCFLRLQFAVSFDNDMQLPAGES